MSLLGGSLLIYGQPFPDFYLFFLSRILCVFEGFFVIVQYVFEDRLIYEKDSIMVGISLDM